MRVKVRIRVKVRVRAGLGLWLKLELGFPRVKGFEFGLDFSSTLDEFPIGVEL